MGLRGRRTIAGVLEGLEHVFGGFLGAFLGFGARGTILGVLKGWEHVFGGFLGARFWH